MDQWTGKALEAAGEKQQRFQGEDFESLDLLLIIQHLPWYVTVDKYSLKGEWT